MTDAEATIRFAIKDAIAATAHIHNIRPDRQIKEVEDALFASLSDSDIAWAWSELVARESV